MTILWNRLSFLGTLQHHQTPVNRCIVLTNRIALTATFFSILFFLIALLQTGWNISAPLFLLSAVVFGSVLFLNSKDHTTASRLLLSLFIPFATLTLSIVSKVSLDKIEIFRFYDARFMLLVSAILPFIIFQWKELKLLLIGLSGSFLSLLFFDQLHYLADVGYGQVHLIDKNYAFINLIGIICYILFVGITCILKLFNERAERLLSEKIVLLTKSNYELQELYSEIEAQNEKIQAQSEELSQNQEVLKNANSIIEQQKEALLLHNKDLQAELIVKNSHLLEANKELAKHVNELQQFSYTLSHNLRGPVASLLGLTYLFDKNTPHKENREIIEHICTSALRVDEIIKELSQIIEIRNNLYNVREWVSIENEFYNVLEEFQTEIKSSGANIEANFRVEEIYSIKAFVHSILHNLVSNSLKYRSLRRSLHITASTYTLENHLILEISDNGMGIDLQKFGPNLFGMYKRFHDHLKGKGLGLYLVKLQAETLGGNVKVESEAGIGSKFIIDLGEISKTAPTEKSDSPY